MAHNEMDEVFAALGIPGAVKAAYASLGLHALYDWQRDCLYTTNVLRGDNLVYCAPTSGGKTLIAELVLLKVVLGLKKKAVFVLPYVSLVLEKERHLKKMIRGYNSSVGRDGRKVVVKAYCGDTTSRKYDADILICTIEKANAIVNSFVSRKNIHALGCVVLDETHVLGSSFNGYLLELLVCKLLYMQQFLHARVQTVALSATMGNVQQLAEWMRARLFVTTFRPVPLYEYVKAGSQVFDLRGDLVRSLAGSSKEDPEGILELCREGVAIGQQIIVFCPTKQQCLQTAEYLHKQLGVVHHRSGVHISQANVFRETLAGTIDSTYCQSAHGALAGGICFHNSSLSVEARLAIEMAYREGQVSILCATSTLAAGVNLPAGRVIIKSLQLGRDVLSPYNYRQMCGRAGRAGQASVGECYLCVTSGNKERAIDVATQALPHILSQLNVHVDGSALLRGVLEVIGLELCVTAEDVTRFLNTTLWALQTGFSDVIAQVVGIYLDYLLEARIVERIATPTSGSSDRGRQTVRVTKLGDAILQSNFNPDEGLFIYNSICHALEGLCLDHTLHIVYLVTPFDHALRPDFRRLLQLYDRSRKEKSFLFRLFSAVHVQSEHLSKWIIHPPSHADIEQCTSVLRCSGISTLLKSLQCTASDGTRVATTKALPSKLSSSEWTTLCVCKRLWAAMALQALVDGTPLEAVCREFQCDIHALATLHRQARIYLSKVGSFCKALGYMYMCKILKDYKNVLDVDVPKELKQLLEIPRMTRKIAQVLWGHKIQTVDKLLSLDVDNIVQCIYISMGFEARELSDVHCAFAGAAEGEAEVLPQSETTEAVLSRDDALRCRLKTMVVALLDSARTIRAEPLSAEEEQPRIDANATNAGLEEAVVSATSETESDCNSDSDKDSNESIVDETDYAESEAMQVESDDFGDYEPPFKLARTDAAVASSSVGYDRSRTQASLPTPPATPLRRMNSGEFVGANHGVLPFYAAASSLVPGTAQQLASATALTAGGSAAAGSALKRVVITPYTRSSLDPFAAAVEQYVTDEDLMYMMQELEAGGLLVSSVSDSSPVRRSVREEFDYVPLVPAHERDMKKPRGLGGLRIAIEPVLAHAQSWFEGNDIKTVRAIGDQPKRLSFSAFETIDEESLLRMMEAYDANPAPILAIPAPEKEERCTPMDKDLERTPARTTAPKSPYLTPFTASKVSAMGHYLYHPQRLFESAHLRSPRPLQAVVGSEVTLLSLDRAPAAADMVHRLQVCPYLSMELIYKPLPVGFLSSPLYVDTYVPHPGRPLLRDGLQSWASLVSARCSPASRPSSSASDLSLPIAVDPKFNGHEGSTRGDALVLVGIVLCVGPPRRRSQDSTGAELDSASCSCYQLRLPCPLPTPRFSVSSNQYNAGDNASGLSQVLSLDTLPIRAKQQIAMFVGFASLLCKAPGLRAHLQSSPLQEYGHSAGQCASNALLTTSRNWCLVCRMTLLLHWRQGGAVEWTFMQALLRAPGITVIAAHMPSLLVLLRERDILVSATLRDPAVGLELCRVAGLPTPQEVHHPVSVRCGAHVYACASPPENKKCAKSDMQAGNDPLNRLWLGMHSSQRSALIAAARAFSAFKTQAALEVTTLAAPAELSLRELYHNVECPALNCVAAMLTSGLLVDSTAMLKLVKSLSSRKEVLLSLLQGSLYKDFNPDSPGDCRRLNEQLASQARVLFAQKPRLVDGRQVETFGVASPLPRHPDDHSDWSAGKDAQAADHAEEDFVTAFKQRHPLHLLVSEWHQHVSNVAMLNSVLRYRKRERVCSYYHLIGSDTGRMIASHPAIQQFPKTISYIPPELPTVWDEVGAALKRAPGQALDALNASLRRAPEYCHLVRPLCDASLQQGLPEACRPIYQQYCEQDGVLEGARRVVKLTQVLPRTVRAPAPWLRGSSPEPVGTRARPVGEMYEGYEGVKHDVLQAVVELAGSVPTPSFCSPSVVVPVDMLRRVAASWRPQRVEPLAIAESLNPTFDPFGDSPALAAWTAAKLVVTARNAVRAAPGYVFVAGDYCQIELRLLAHFCEDPGLLRAFAQSSAEGQVAPSGGGGKPDVFRSLARQWYKMAADVPVPEDMRKVVKQVCYAVLYGAGPRLIAQEAGLPLPQAQFIYKDFLQRFPRISEFTGGVVEQCQERGFVETLLGRRRALSGICSDRDGARMKAARQAVNSTCQGSAADLIKLAMVNIDSVLQDRWRRQSSLRHGSTPWQYRAPRSHPGAGLYRGADEVRLVLQVHDEVVFEVREEVALEVAAIVRVCMEHAVTLKVPLEAKLSIGPSWGELREVDAMDPQLLEEVRADVLQGAPPVDKSLLPGFEGTAAAGIAKNLFGSE